MLDPKTALLALIVNSFFCLSILFFMWIKSRKFYEGVGWWVFQAAAQTLAFTVSFARFAFPAGYALSVGGAVFIGTLPALTHGMDIFAHRQEERGVSNRSVAADAVIALLLGLAFIALSLTDDYIDYLHLPLALAFLWFYARSAATLYRSVRNGRKGNVPAFAAFGSLSAIAASFFVLRLAFFKNNETGRYLEGAEYLALTAIVTITAFAQILMLIGRVTSNLACEQLKIRTIFNAAPYSIIMTRYPDGTILECNERFCRYSGYRMGEILGRTSLELGIWADASTRADLYRNVRDSGQYEGENRHFRRRDGLTIPCYVSARMLSCDGESAVLTIIKDMTEIQRLNRKIEEMATLDHLTGLPNRRYFYDLAAGILARSVRAAERVAIVTAALDDFKRINDTYGQAQGDQILVETGSRIKAELREGDLLARFAGDEFVVLLSDIHRDEDILLVMDRIIKGFERTFEVAGVETRVSCSLGAASFPDQAGDLDALIALSDAMVHEAKIAGKRCYKLARDKTS